MLQNEVTHCCLSNGDIMEVRSIYWPELFPAVPVTVTPISRRWRCARLLPTPQIKTLHLSCSYKIFSPCSTEYFGIVCSYIGLFFAVSSGGKGTPSYQQIKRIIGVGQ